MHCPDSCPHDVIHGCPAEMPCRACLTVFCTCVLVDGKTAHGLDSNIDCLGVSRVSSVGFKWHFYLVIITVEIF